MWKSSDWIAKIIFWYFFQYSFCYCDFLAKLSRLRCASLRLSEKFRKCLLIRWRRARDHRSRKFLTAGRKNSWKIRILRLFRSVKILFSLFDSWIFKFSVKLKSRSLNGKVPLIFIQIKASVVTVSFFVKTKVKKGRILSSFFISKRWVTVL